jgi:threonylcarbamoyladenosine tRNA methylthiotransferase MtaB
MEMDQIRQELIAIQSEGYHECVLTGINLGEYRSSSDHRFIDVLRLVHDMELSIRVRIGSIEPNTLRDEVIDVWQNTETIVPHLHMPLQSGSDALLRLMRRRYNSSLYRDRVESFVSRFSDPGIGIDVITGFPGETEQLFIETVDFLQSIPWTYLHVFTYSERDDTPAASAEGKVDIAERRRRTNVLRAISDERTQQFHRSQLGKHKIFLPEGYDAEVGCWNGWTENHVKAWMAGPFELPKIRYAVKLESLYRDGIFVTPSRSGVSE